MSNDYFDYYGQDPKKNKKHGIGGIAIAVIIIFIFLTGIVLGAAIIYATNNNYNSSHASISPNNTDSYTNNPNATNGITEIPQITPPPIDQTEPIVEIAEKLTPAVVAVYNKTTKDGADVVQGTGSGVIITKDGYIISNEHVVAGAQKLTVVLNDKRELDARLIGKDARTDLAVLKIVEEGNFTAASLGVSNDLKVGQLVVAIGNPLGYAGTVTSGIVSALNRVIDSEGRRFKMIQTDAAINPGNSGGPLFNKYGQVIGITSMKEVYTTDASGAQIAIEGLGYAIPIDTAKPIISQLITNGVVKRAGLGITGSTAYDDNNQPIGVVIRDVVKDGSSDKAGILVDDIIIKINGDSITTLEDLTEQMETKMIGEEITVVIMRDKTEKTVNITLGTLAS